MLYHVPDLGKGLSEVRRVLKGDGRFYCATLGDNKVSRNRWSSGLA
ncbi:MAG: class I SAM-dependent methyltransferase [Pseudobutyrivibrio sp.]|nr:class I SAM-dependent methyltransferase [Pseudobutyrivibrio sp.]